MNAAEARHHAANLLHAYTEAADARDVDAAVALLADAEVSLPSGGFTGAEQARPFLERAWATSTTQRHDVSSLAVHPAGDDWVAQAHYVRWTIADEPSVHTLGHYELLLSTDGGSATIRRLTVTRQWTRA